VASSGTAIVEVATAERMQSMLEFSIDPSTGWRSVPRDGNALLFSGGYLSEHDGKGVLEAGFLQYPDAPTLSNGGSAAAKKVANGTYGVMLVYVRLNAAGLLIRSQASLPKTFTMTGGNTQLQVVASTLRIGAAPAVAKIEVYCTVNGGSTYFLETTITNDPTVDTVTTTLSTPDATLQAASTVYTSGGVSDDVQRDAPLILTSTPSRLFTVDGSSPTLVQPSKELLNGIDIGFYGDAATPIHQGDEEILALGYLSGRLFAWKSRSMFVASGDGPDLTGSNNTLGVFEQFSNDVGLLEATSLVVLSFGIVFRSHRGFYLLGRDGNLAYIGADIEDNTTTIIDAAYCEDAREIRFLLTGGTSALVLTIFETKEGVQWKWSTDTYGQAVSAITVANGVFVCSYFQNPSYLLGTLSASAANLFADFNASNVTMNVEFGWMSFAGIQGFQRVYSILVLGDDADVGGYSENLQAYINYDYQTGTEELHQITHTNAQDGSTHFQVEICPQIQKCQSIRLRLRVLGVAGVSLAGLAFVVGTKGWAKLAPNKVM
jgi:hypothetical protein